MVHSTRLSGVVLQLSPEQERTDASTEMGMDR